MSPHTVLMYAAFIFVYVCLGLCAALISGLWGRWRNDEFAAVVVLWPFFLLAMAVQGSVIVVIFCVFSLFTGTMSLLKRW